MTWVIATPSALGYGVAVADIQVTFGPGQTSDCLQKIYPVAPFIAAGFSGSVEFGFWCIRDLQLAFNHLAPDEAWIPGWVAFKWYRRARRAYAEAAENIRRNGAAVVLAGVSPICDLGSPGTARPTVAIMRAPEFFPQLLKINQVEAIGSGSGVESYVKELRRLEMNYPTLWQAEVRNPGGYGMMLMDALHRTIRKQPTEGISPHLHLCVVHRGRFVLMNTDHTWYPPGGPEIEVRMPAVAQSWSEFVTMCSSDNSVEASQATC